MLWGSSDSIESPGKLFALCSVIDAAGAPASPSDPLKENVPPSEDDIKLDTLVPEQWTLGDTHYC